MVQFDKLTTGFGSWFDWLTMTVGFCRPDPSDKSYGQACGRGPF